MDTQATSHGVPRTQRSARASVAQAARSVAIAWAIFAQRSAAANGSIITAGWTSAALIVALDIYGMPETVRSAWQVVTGAGH